MNLYILINIFIALLFSLFITIHYKCNVFNFRFANVNVFAADIALQSELKLIAVIN